MDTITSQEQHVLWAANSTLNPNYSCKNDEQTLLRTAFSYGLIAARKINANYDSLSQTNKLYTLKLAAEAHRPIKTPTEISL